MLILIPIRLPPLGPHGRALSVASKCIDFSAINDGRFANQAIAYLVLSEVATVLGLSICLGENEMIHFENYPNILNKTIRSSVRADNKVGHGGCGPYFQHYQLMQDLREKAVSVFSPSETIKNEAKKYNLTRDDAVIHFRLYEIDPNAPFSFAPYSYFVTILHHLRRAKLVDRVYIACEPHLVLNKIVADLMLEQNVTYLDVSLHAQIHIARSANTLIGSFGSLSFFLAFLSSASQIHLPFFSAYSKGCFWAPLSDLFIHDDERIFYHDLSRGIAIFNGSQKHVGKAAGHVLASQTPFSKNVISRKSCVWSLFPRI